MAEIETYQDLRKHCELIVKDIVEDVATYDEAIDRLHEEIDGDENVIYYSKSWDTVNAARQDSELYDAADEMANELDIYKEKEDLDMIMSGVAYCVLYVMCSEMLQEKNEQGAFGSEE